MRDHDSSHDPKKTLSEISHLFLSSIRERHTNGAPPPQRKGPGDAKPQAAEPVADLSAEEFAHVSGMEAHDAQGDDDAPAEPVGHKVAPVSAVVAAHLNGKQFDRVKEYARHLAGQFGRVGLIELDASEFRLM